MHHLRKVCKLDDVVGAWEDRSLIVGTLKWNKNRERGADGQPGLPSPRPQALGASRQPSLPLIDHQNPASPFCQGKTPSWDLQNCRGIQSGSAGASHHFIVYRLVRCPRQLSPDENLDRKRAPEANDNGTPTLIPSAWVGPGLGLGDTKSWILGFFPEVILCLSQ